MFTDAFQNPFCNSIVGQTCYIRSPLNIIVPANVLGGAGTTVRLNLTSPYRKTSISAKTNPLLFCTAAVNGHKKLSTLALCLKTALKFLGSDKDVVQAAFEYKQPKNQYIYIDVATNLILEHPTNQEKQFAKRYILCFLLLFAVLFYVCTLFLSRFLNDVKTF